jgi:hypothetical protein
VPSSGSAAAPAGRVERAADDALALEVREVLVHRGERAEPHRLGDLLEARRVAVLVDVPGEVVEDLALAPGERHGRLRRVALERARARRYAEARLTE